jgi:hypothetical protein
MRPGEAESSGAVIAELMREALSNAGILDAVPAMLYGGFAGVGREEERPRSRDRAVPARGCRRNNRRQRRRNRAAPTRSMAAPG